MELKLLMLLVFKVTIPKLKDFFMEKQSLKNDATIENDLQRVFKYSLYPRDSKKFLIKEVRKYRRW